MSTLGDVIAQIRGALDKSDEVRQTLIRADHLLDEATQYLRHTFQGSHDPEAEQAMGLLTQAQHGLAELYGVLDNANKGARRYVDRLGADTTAPTATVAPGAGAPVSGLPTPERIEQLRAELPPPVVRNTGQKTHGRWIAPDGRVHAEVSGRDEKYDEAIQLFKDIRAHRIPARASDVEMKLARSHAKERHSFGHAGH